MRFFGESADEFYKKKYNIFIGISISNKKITSEMALNYLRWAVENTKEKVAVIIADELNVVNYEILDKYSRSKSEKRAQVVGEQFEKLFENAKEKLDSTGKNKVKIYRWKEVKNNFQYQKVKNFLEKQYNQDAEFKSAVLYFTKKYIEKKGKIITDEDRLDKLSSYIIGELPTLLEGIDVNETHYRLCIYPTYSDSSMSEFAMNLHEQKLKIGRELKRLLKSKAVLVEAWLN